MPLFKRFIFVCLFFYIPSVATFADNKPEEIRVTNSISWPPFSFINEDGEARGILVDLWQEIAKQQGVKLIYQHTSWANTLTLLQDRKVDIHAGLFHSTERDKFLDFSDPIGIPIATRLFISNKLTIDGIYDIGNIPVGVTAKGFAESYLKKNYPNVKIQAYPNSKEVIEAAISGDILAFAIDYAAGMYYLHKNNTPHTFHATDTLYNERLRAAVAEGDKETLNFINRALKELPSDEFDRIISKWIQSENSIPSWIIPAVISAFVSLFLFFIILYVVVLKRQVKAKTSELKILSETDALTKLFNRKKIEDELDKEFVLHAKDGAIFSIILLDIDNFKNINDTFGHSVGDDVLIQISELLRSNIRHSDTLARWGGEEFLIVCHDTSKERALVLANKLQNTISNHEFNAIKRCTASFGITQITPDDNNRDLFIRVDKALYQSKAEGKNRVTCL